MNAMSSFPVAHPAVNRSVAEVLAELAAEIELLGATLCSHPVFVADHIGELQAIDLIAQKLGTLSGLLAADCAATALGTVPLDALRERFAHLAQELSGHLPH